MTLLAGAARVDITPPLPSDLLGYVRRERAARTVGRPLLVTAAVLRDETSNMTMAMLAADLVGMPPDYAWRLRQAVAQAIDGRPEDVLINVSHTHAAPWPAATMKMGGEFDGWTDNERAFVEWLPAAFASAASQAAHELRPARAAGGVGRVHQLAVNRRERTGDGRTILGWNRNGFVDEEVPVIRIDDLAGRAIATIVGFACHPVVVGPDSPAADPDFVGPLREAVEAQRGGVCLFLQGAAGNVLPLEAFQDARGPEEAMGRRLGLEAVHAIADVDPREIDVRRIEYGSVTPIALYRRQPSDEQPSQTLRAARRVLRLPLLEPPSLDELLRELSERRADLQERRERGESRVTTNTVAYHAQWLEATIAAVRANVAPRQLEGEVWAARIADCAIATGPGEIFGEIGAAVRRGSPAAVTIYAGYSQGVLGYVATPEEYPYGGYEPVISHRGYGHPAPFSPEVAGILRSAAAELLQEVFA